MQTERPCWDGTTKARLICLISDFGNGCVDNSCKAPNRVIIKVSSGCFSSNGIMIPAMSLWWRSSYTSPIDRVR